MSTSRRSSTARRSARLSSARMSSALERSSWPDNPPIWRSISPTIRSVDSRWRSRLVSSSLTSWTCPCSRSCCSSSRSRSRRICWSRFRLASREESWACADGGVRTARMDRTARTARSVGARSRRFLVVASLLSVVLHMPQMPPHAHQAAPQTQQHPEDDHGQHLKRVKEDEPRERPAALVPEQEIPAVAERQRQESAQETLE